MRAGVHDAPDAEPTEADRFPSHCHLEHAVKFVLRSGLRNRNAPPDHRAGRRQADPQPQKRFCLRCCLGVRHAKGLQEALHNAGGSLIRTGAQPMPSTGPGWPQRGDNRDVATKDLPEVVDSAWAPFPCRDLPLAGDGAGPNGGRSGTFLPFWGPMTVSGEEGPARRTTTAPQPSPASVDRRTSPRRGRLR